MNEPNKARASDWRDSLNNWKFNRALRQMPKHDPDRAIVECLSGLFGDSGWFEGEIGALIEMVVERILSDD